MTDDAIADLFGRGEPVDAITVAGELTKRGQLQRVGGHAYIHDLIQSVPTSANAAYYAEIVAERARCCGASSTPAPAPSRWAMPRRDTSSTSSTPPRPRCMRWPTSAAARTTRRCRTSSSRPCTRSRWPPGRSDEMTGVPTGFIELDELTHGLHPGQMIVKRG